MMSDAPYASMSGQSSAGEQRLKNTVGLSHVEVIPTPRYLIRTPDCTFRQVDGCQDVKNNTRRR